MELKHKTIMAKIMGITDEMLTKPFVDIHAYEFQIEEGTEHAVAERLMKEHSNIIYCNYWNDADERGEGRLTYSIDRNDIARFRRFL